MKRKYKEINFSPDRLKLIDMAVAIVAKYKAAGYALTLRQLYYQFVSKDAFPASWIDASTGSTNNERSYKKLGDIIGDARMAGLLDWSAIEDRTRELSKVFHWENPAQLVQTYAHYFKLDKWVGQKYRVEVWVEKDALEGVVGKVCKELDVSFFSCRGYASMTSIWDAGQRLKNWASQHEQQPVILHLGDHDPSGLDMSRDIQERVQTFMDGEAELEFERIALNMNQIRELRPPPNPAKVTDSRHKKYQEEFGDECWELDALEPAYIDNLIRQRVRPYLDLANFQEVEREEQRGQDQLQYVASNWDKIHEEKDD